MNTIIFLIIVMIIILTNTNIKNILIKNKENFKIGEIPNKLPGLNPPFDYGNDYIIKGTNKVQGIDIPFVNRTTSRTVLRQEFVKPIYDSYYPTATNRSGVVF